MFRSAIYVFLIIENPDFIGVTSTQALDPSSLNASTTTKPNNFPTITPTSYYSYHHPLYADESMQIQLCATIFFILGLAFIFMLGCQIYERFSSGSISHITHHKYHWDRNYEIEEVKENDPVVRCQSRDEIPSRGDNRDDVEENNGPETDHLSINLIIDTQHNNSPRRKKSKESGKSEDLQETSFVKPKLKYKTRKKGERRNRKVGDMHSV